MAEIYIKYACKLILFNRPKIAYNMGNKMFLRRKLP